jgi:hypothetical protein
MSRLLARIYTLPEQAVEAARQLAERLPPSSIDVHSPYHLHELEEILPVRPQRVSLAVLLGATVGALSAYGVQYLTVVKLYPFRVGDTPYHSWPAFLPITFEMGVLLSALSCLAAVLFFSGLPRYHHQVFDLPGFERTSIDRFAVAVEVRTAEEIALAREVLGAEGEAHEL